MIKGILLDELSVVTSIPSEFKFGYVRARKIGKDDQKFADNCNLLLNAGIPFGVFNEFDYINPSDNPTDPAHPTNQAQELAGKDRGFYKLLPMFKLMPKEGYPVTNWGTLTSILSDSIYWYKVTYGKRMVGFAGSKSWLEAMIPYLTSNISECWHDLIYPSSSFPALKPPYGPPAFWEQTLYDQTFTGATKVGVIAWPGTQEQLLGWNGELNKIPVWDIQVVEPSSSPSRSLSPSSSPSHSPSPEAPVLTIEGKDISIWQDDNSTPQMFNFDTAVQKGVRFFGIKVSQANWLDQDFVMNWANCKLRKFKRMGYHFLSWDIPIVDQANVFISALRNDPGEIYPVVDFEMRTGAPSATVASEKLWEFISRVESGLARQMMIYTSPSYWREFGSTNIKFNKPLWIANYNVSYPTIPEPFSSWLFWQYGLGKGTGLSFGAESLDLDQDVFNGDEAKYTSMFGSELPQVYTPSAKALVYSVNVTTLNVRSGPGTNYPVVTTLSKGTLVYPQEIDGSSAWVKTDKGWVCVTLSGSRYLVLV